MTSFGASFGTGFAFFLQGFTLIWRSGIRAYALAPIAINVVVFALLIWWGTREFTHLMDWMLPDSSSWWINWLRPLLWIVFSIIALLIMFFAFTMLANLIGAPFNGLLSARVEIFLTGQGPADAGLADFLKDIGPLLWNETKKILYSLLWILPVLILFVIPVVNLAAPFVWFTLMAWLMALNYLDYPLGNHGARFREVRTFLRQRRSLALGFGTAVLLTAMVPGLNLVVMPAAVAGATILWTTSQIETTTKSPE